jgi:hypothetical protein
MLTACALPRVCSQEAIEYGLIDQVLESTRELPVGLIPTAPKQEEDEEDLGRSYAPAGGQSFGGTADLGPADL